MFQIIHAVYLRWYTQNQLDRAYFLKYILNSKLVKNIT